MADFNYVINTRTGVKRRLMPGDTVRDGEVIYVPFDQMHQPAVLELSDAAVGAFLQDGTTDAKADDVPPGFFRDSYGRLLVSGTTSGDDRADGKALAARLLYEQDLQDAWKLPESA